jgi:hypothetical protein
MKKRCFVLMPFAPDYRAVYENAIRPAAVAAGFECHRASSQDYMPRAIMREVVESIFDADVIIADITGANANVFYELGIAHTLGNKTILICESPPEGQKLPFDISSYLVLFYHKPSDGVWMEFLHQLERALRGFPHNGNAPTNPVQDFRPIKYATPLQAQAKLESRIEELEKELSGLRQDKWRGILLSLPHHELGHLFKLAAGLPFCYKMHDAFINELRKLRTLGAIKMKQTDQRIVDIPAVGDDLKQYIELTEIAKSIFSELSKWLPRG